MPRTAPDTDDCAAARPQQRLSADARRAELIEATLATIADEGLHAATLRRVAERAGVSNGLIRHHFSGKQQMILAAYAEVIDRMTLPGRAALARRDLAPIPRLAGFIRASLDPGVTEPRLFSIWAAFVALVHLDPEFESAHRAGYLDYQAGFEPLLRAALTEAGHLADLPNVPKLVMQINALIDGLWVEGSLLGPDFAEGTLIELALDGAGRILNIELERLS